MSAPLRRGMVVLLDGVEVRLARRSGDCWFYQEVAPPYRAGLAHKSAFRTPNA